MTVYEGKMRVTCQGQYVKCACDCEMCMVFLVL